MSYIKEALVYLAVLIAIASSQPDYGRRRSTKYLPPRRSYKPVKEVVKTYNPVKEVVKTYNPVKKVVQKDIHSKHTSKIPFVDPLGPIIPDQLGPIIPDQLGPILPGERPSVGGFLDPLVGGIDRIGDQRRPVRAGEIPWGPSGNFNPRVSRGNGRRDGAGLIPRDPIGRRSSDPWIDENRRGDQFPSSGNPWVDESLEPSIGRDAFPWTDINGPQLPFPQNNGGLPGTRRSSQPGFIDESLRRDWNPTEADVGGILDRNAGGLISGEGLPLGDREPALRDLSPSMTRLLRDRLRDTVSNAGRNRGFRNTGRVPRGRSSEFIPTLRDRQNWMCKVLIEKSRGDAWPSG